ncbi:MAG: hypothetical protein P8018_14125 [Acidobacteriota bacterium]
MRRVRETTKAAQAAVDADSDDEAALHWKAVFGDLWPTPAEIAEEARVAAMAAKPGHAYVDQAGGVSAIATAGAIKSRPTTFHGPKP